MLRTLCLVSAILGATLTSWFSSPQAGAAVQYSSVYNCHATGGRAMDQNYAMANDSTTSDLVLRCDAPDRTGFRSWEIESVQVKAWDATTVGRVSAQACYSNFFSNGGSCGPSVASDIETVKMASLPVDLAAWRRSWGNFPYIAIRIPRRYGTSRSAAKGITYSN